MYVALSYQDEHDDDDRVVREVMMGMVGPHGSIVGSLRGQ